MKNFLRTVLSAALLALGMPFAANAQYQLRVITPASVSGTVQGTGNPTSTGWGFGDPESVLTLAVGFAKYASPDTLVSQTPANVGNLAGKIAVVYRGGGIMFSEKALACQQAGAIGVIIINKTNGSPGGMAAGSVGSQVTIPVILVPLSWEPLVRDFIHAGTLRVGLGNPLGAFSLNLSLFPNQVVCPSPTHIPSFMVKAPGDLKFNVGANVINQGNATQTGVRLTAKIEKIGGTTNTVLYQRSKEIASISASGTPGDTLYAVTDSIFPPFDLVVAQPGLADYSGHYRLSYDVFKVSAPQGDSVPDNNHVQFDFYVGAGGNSYTRGALDLTSPTFQPIATQFSTIAPRSDSLNRNTFKYGQYIRMGSVSGKLNSVTYATSTLETTTTLAGKAITLEVSEWNDLDGDQSIDNFELTLLGNKIRLFTSESQREQFITDNIQDLNTGTNGVLLRAGRRYIIVWSYVGSDGITVGTYKGQNFTQYIEVATPPEYYASVINVANENNWGIGFWGLDLMPAFRIDISDTSVRDGITTTSLSPLSGPIGTTVTISGNNLGNATSVSINGTAATIVTNTNTQLVVRVLPGTTTGPVLVTTPLGTASNLSFAVCTSPAQPIISLSGTSSLCSGGSAILTAPAGFSYLWSTGATTQSITVSGAGSFTVQTITGACTSAVSPAVVTTVSNPPAPTIAANGTTNLSITGSVTISTNYVLALGEAYLWSNGATTQSITVTQANNFTLQIVGIGTACSSARSNVITTLFANPSVTSFAPFSGPVGERVSIRGRLLSLVRTVFFNSTAVTQWAVSGDTLITAIVPPGATAGQIGVSLAANAGIASFRSAAFFYPTGDQLLIRGFTPASGRVGDVVNITGRRLSTHTGVRFNGALSTSVQIIGDTLLRAVVPSGSSTGKIIVSNAGGRSIFSATDFIVIAPPQISSFSPASGPIGERVRVRGIGLRGILGVYFGNTASTDWAVSGDTLLTAIVPPGAVNGRIGVVTQLPQGPAPVFAARSQAFFNITFAPVIRQLIPPSGRAGDTVRIMGRTLATVIQVRFSNNALQAQFFRVLSDTMVKTVVPVGALTGAVRVINRTFSFANSPTPFVVVGPSPFARYSEEHGIAHPAGLTMYPNPVSNNRFSIESGAEILQIRVLTVTGVVLHKEAASGHAWNVKASLPTGTYIAEITLSTGIERRMIQWQ